MTPLTLTELTRGCPGGCVRVRASASLGGGYVATPGARRAPLQRRGLIDDRIVREMRGWRHSGFSVDRSVRLAAGDRRGRERLARYLVRCPFSLSRMIRVTEEGKVLYRAEKAECRRFPGGGGFRAANAGAELFGGVSRNFQVFDPLDFLAEVTLHIPDPWEHLVRYDGWYSNKSRGLRANGTAANKVRIDMSVREIRGGERLGGLLRHYYRKAVAT